VRAEELSLAAHEKDLSAAAAALSKLDERVASVRAELEAAIRVLESLGAEGEAARGELLHAEADRAARDERVRLLSHEIEALEARAAEQREQQTALKVKVAATAEKVEGAQRAATFAQARVAELSGRAERASAAHQEATAHVAALRERIATTSQETAQRQEQLTARQNALETRRAQHAELTQSVREQEGELKALREQLDEAAEGLSALQLTEREAAIELTHLEQQVKERWALPIGEAVGEFHLERPLDEAEKARLKDLRTQVERMGEVNVAAIEELEEVAKRYEFLLKQRGDLESSIEQLKAAIKKIDATSRERFTQTFEAVNERFQKIFPRLFGGGRAGLVLTEEQPGMEAGVEIVAQPPGKKLQSVQLLSGGEKALTAVSMIFAIFLIKPTPFCLLDEVDAPLDEANVGRYNDMVKEMSKQSQFILITHNKRTMEIVDNLYGVTMEEPGISKLVTVKLREATAANDDKVVA
jgi:chromosome segregation protein